MCMYIYKRTYINSYEEIKLEKIAVYEDESLKNKNTKKKPSTEK